MNVKKLIKKYLISGGSMFIASFIVADVLNLLFNLFLGRVLTPEEFGTMNFVNALWTFLNIFYSAFGITIMHKAAFMNAEKGQDEAISFYRFTFRRAAVLAGILFIAWMIASPFIAQFFHIPLLACWFFAPIIATGLLHAVNHGFLQGKLYLSWLAFIIVASTLSKLLLAVILWGLHLDSFVYTSIIAAEIVIFVLGMILTYWKTRGQHRTHSHRFPLPFFTASVVTKLSGTSFLLLDVIFAKHFFSPKIAGQYALLALVGKMVFYFGSLLTNLIVPLISRDEGRGKNPEKTFTALFWGGAAMTFFIYLIVGVFGYITMPILFHERIQPVISYFPLYGLAIALFTLSNQIVTYRLSRKQYIYPITALFFSMLVVAGMSMFHKSIADIVYVVFAVSSVSFITLFIMNMLNVEGRFIRRNIIDFLEIFLPVGNAERRMQAKKRVLFFNWRDTRHVFAGGAEVYVHEIAKRWVAQGYYVTVFCGNDGKTPRHEIIDGVEIIRRGGFYFVFIWAFVYYILRFRGKYDVIVDSENGVPFFTPLFAKEPVYCLMHHVHQNVFKRSLSWPLAAIATFLEKQAMPVVYRNVPFITVSDSTKKDMERIGLGKKGITIIHPGVDLSALYPAKKSKHPVVLYLGRLKEYKSIDVFIHAVPELAKEFPKAEFIIAGEGEEESNLKKLAKKLNVADKVKFTGKVSEQEKLALYQKAWVLVNPSMMEGWGITTIEANACGTPVVASDVPGLRDSVNHSHSGYLFPYGDVEQFMTKVSILIQDKKQFENMSKASVAWAKTFTWEKSAEKAKRVLNM